MTLWRGVPVVVWCALLCGVLRYAGAVWDVAWHRTLGRDSLLSPPHVLLYVGVIGATLASAFLYSRAARGPVKKAAALALGGNALMVAAAPFDAMWHAAVGPDADIWSPPHLLAVFGCGLSALGWLLAIRTWPTSSKGLSAIGYVFLGWLAYAGWFSLNWYQMDAASRDALFYPSLVGLVVVPVLTVARAASRARFGATIGSLLLVGFCALPAAFFPALGWVGPGLAPALLFVPALALDMLLLGRRQRLARFVVGSLAFGALFVLSEHTTQEALPAVTLSFLAGGLIGWLLEQVPSLRMPNLLSDPGLDSLLGPAERLRFERMRLGIRVGLLIGPTLLIVIYGLTALGPALVAAAATLGSSVLVVVLLRHKPAQLLRYQLVFRLLDIGLVWLSLDAIQGFMARAQFDQVYLLPVVSATGTHGKRGAYVVSGAAAIAVVATRARLVLAGAMPFEPIVIGDALMHVALFFITGSMLDMLMRTSAGVVEQLRRSEKQEAQAALRESEARYRHVSELMSDFAFGFRILPSGMHCEWVTEAMPRITGYTLADLEAAGGWRKLIHADDFGAVHTWLEALGRGESHSAEFRIVTRAGEVRILRGHARPLLDATGTRVERIYGAAQDVTERKRWEAALEHQALHDSLTDLPNRALLQDRLVSAIAMARRDGSCLALMMMDLNRFKDVNDTFGHHHGDLLLQQVGQRLRASLRDSDTVARLGGDEFAVLLPTAAAQEATLVSRKLLRALETPFEVEGHRLEIGASIGLAVFPDHGLDADTLLRQADTAMYTAKRVGGGCSVYESQMDRDSVNRPQLIGELRHAIEHGELVLHYQPKVQVATGAVVGVEALVRWQHPGSGMLPPDRFIGLAEETGLIKPLTEWVLRTAVRQSAEWHRLGLQLPVAVNLSARNLHDRDLPRTVAAILAECRAQPGWLELEVTESCLLDDLLRARQMLSELRELGVRMAIDDFGTGYSSLAYLKQLPVQQLKIDRGFVQQVGRDENDAAIVRATVELGHSLGLAVVAEGVEDEAAWQYLSELGCDEAQGFLIARPVPADELLAWLLSEDQRAA